MGKHNFKKLKIWQEGMVLVEETYKMIREFPTMEKFNLVSQLIRCAVSIPSNIAEGCSRNSEMEFKRFLEIAIGSLFEVETQLTISQELGFIESENLKPIFEQCNQHGHSIGFIPTLYSYLLSISNILF